MTARSASAGTAAGAATNSAAAPVSASAGPSTGGQIQADPATNALIITAAEPQYRQLRAVIDQLDSRRAQVYVESLIAEVNADKAAEFGIQWQGILGKQGDGTVGVIGTNSGQAGANILGITAALATGNASSIATAAGTLGQGMNLALAPRINGQYYLGALANFLQNSGDANVLSTPNLMTLDNEEARIIIGNNVPFVTGSYANTTGSSTVSPFQTVERKDVGLMLKVRPQISENGTVKMAIYQEVSKIDTATLSNANGPSTSKRSIESNVVVDDGSIIVIGGLLEDSYQQGQDKVPVMGDLPVVGNLFRSETRSRNKTNLMVFLRPIVVRDNATSDALMMDRYEAIRALQQATQPAASTVMKSVSGAPILPSLPERAPSVASPMPVQPAAPVPVPMQQLTPVAPPPPTPGTVPQSSAPVEQSSPTAQAQVPAPLYYVNVGVFGKDAESRSAMTKLRSTALPLSIQAVDTNRGTLTRVRVGPYNTEDAANAAAATVRDVQGWTASLQWRYLGSGPLVEDNSERAPSALTTNLRVGYLVAEPELVEDLAQLKMISGLTSSEFAERLAHGALTDGRWRKHLKSLRERLAEAHRTVGRRLLNLGFELFHEPEAGMYLWARHPDLPDSAELSKEATGAGIMLGPGQLFLVEPRPTGWLRFNVAFSQDERLWRFLEQRILLGQQVSE